MQLQKTRIYLIKKMQEITEKKFDLDMILLELGEFGRYQIKNFVLICIGVIVLSEMSLSYVFAGGILQYRCRIPGCDQDPYNFNQPWVSNAIPQRNGNPEKCRKYDQLLIPTHPNECQSNTNIFNNSHHVTCNDFIYATDELAVQNEFNLTCDENEWKLTLIGTISNAGIFFFLTPKGILSDRFGRRTIYIYSIFAASIIGIIKSFSVNYIMYIICEFMDASVRAGTYTTAFILAMEMVGPSKRVFGGTLIAVSLTIGEVALGLIAMYTLNFRVLLRIVYCPTLLVLVYFWCIPESVRWQFATGRNEEAIDVILKAAKINKVKLSDEALAMISSNGFSQSKPSPASAENESNRNTSTQDSKKGFELKKALRSRILLLRMVNLFLVWITCPFVYYGLSLNAVTLAGNKFVNFILVSTAEIPGFIVIYFISERIGRKWSLCSSLIVCGISCIGSLYMPPDQSIASLALFLLGKAAITASSTILYVFTSEMFPTSLRNTLFLIVSTVGRIGSMSAPQTVLLAQYVPSLPLLLFGGLSITSGLTALLFPETLHTSLPDTIEEAENIGKNKN